MQISAAGADPKRDEQDVPQVGMQCERAKRIVKPACVCERGNAAQKTVAHEKDKCAEAQVPASKPWVCKQHIHRDAAELERKIPPYISAVSDCESQGELLPDLTCEHECTAGEKQDIGSSDKMC